MNPQAQQAARALLGTPLSEVIADPRHRESLLLTPGLDYASEPDAADFSPHSRPVHQVPVSPDRATLRETMSIMAHKYLGDPFVREESRRRARAAPAYRAHVEHYPQLKAYLAFFDAVTALADSGTPPDPQAIARGIAMLETVARGYDDTHRAFREEMLARERLEDDHYAQITLDMLEPLTQAGPVPDGFPHDLLDRIRHMGMEDQQPVLNELHQWLRAHRPMTENDYALRRAINSRFVDRCDSHEAEVLRYVADRAGAIIGETGL